jgi:hypothetical protein
MQPPRGTPARQAAEGPSVAPAAPAQPKRGRGRPPGSRNRNTRAVGGRDARAGQAQPHGPSPLVQPPRVNDGNQPQFVPNRGQLGGHVPNQAQNQGDGDLQPQPAPAPAPAPAPGYVPNPPQPGRTYGPFAGALLPGDPTSGPSSMARQHTHSQNHVSGQGQQSAYLQRFGQFLQQQLGGQALQPQQPQQYNQPLGPAPSGAQDAVQNNGPGSGFGLDGYCSPRRQSLAGEEDTERSSTPSLATVHQPAVGQEETVSDSVSTWLGRLFRSGKSRSPDLSRVSGGRVEKKVSRKKRLKG